MGRAMIDESGKTYGFLKVLTPKPLPNRNKRGWECECLLCGNKKVISGSDLRTGKATSCGCKRQYIIQEKPGTRYNYIKNDIKGENKNVKVSYLDFRDLQSR